jgi:hypothetical protein
VQISKDAFAKGAAKVVPILGGLTFGMMTLMGN